MLYNQKFSTMEQVLQVENRFTYSRLKSIYYFLSCSELERAEELLKSFASDAPILNAGLRILYLFVQAKLQLIYWNKYSELDHLIKAQGLVEEMVHEAKSSRVKIKSHKYLFLRIVIAQKLSIFSINSTDRKSYLTHAQYLSEIGVAKFPEMVCFKDISEFINKSQVS